LRRIVFLLVELTLSVSATGIPLATARFLLLPWSHRGIERASG